jgi:hypothetical protein
MSAAHPNKGGRPKARKQRRDKMKKVIDGKRYNTETATFVCDCSPRGFYRGDFRYEDTGLYRTKRGNWFLSGEGGPMSRWSRSAGLNSWTGGSGIMPLDSDETRAMLEQHGNSEDVEKYFASELTDA